MCRDSINLRPDETLTTECSNERSRPVGTRGGCEVGRGPCACPRGMKIRLGSVRQHGHTPNEDKHKAPSSTQPRPLSLQDGGTHITAFGWKIRQGYN